MHRVCLFLLRFCLSAWVGIAIFFVALVIDLRQSELFSPETKFEHPKVLFPEYYRFECALLLPAFVCACASMWNESIGRGRRIALLQLVIIATALAAWDFGLIYQKLAEMMAAPPPLPVGFHALHRASLGLNAAVLAACGAAAMLALIPERGRPESPEPHP